MELSKEQVDKILQGITIPPQPQIMVDLQMEQFHPDPDLERIANLICQDVGLSGTILKIVNSPMFGFTNTISSIKQGVMLLGYKSIINIVNGLTIKGELSDEAITELNRFWDTAMDIALVSASIARQIGFSNPDEAYSLGLFHNVGIPLMHAQFDNYFDVVERSYTAEYDRVIDAENEAFHTNHAVVGYYAAKAWKLPKLLCEVIADHHSAQKILKRSQHTEKTTALAILKIAEHLCGNYKSLGKQQRDYEWDAIKDDIFSYTGLGNYDLENMRETLWDMGLNVGQSYADY